MSKKLKKMLEIDELDMDVKSSDGLKADEMMKLGYGLLAFGALCLLVGLYGLLFSDEPDENNQRSALLVMGLFFLGAGSIDIYIFKKKQDGIKKKKLAKINSQYNSVFYDLVEKNNGRVTALQFAKAANINPAEARNYLETQASQLGVVVEVDEQGSIFYTFH